MERVGYIEVADELGGAGDEEPILTPEDALSERRPQLGASGDRFDRRWGRHDYGRNTSITRRRSDHGPGGPGATWTALVCR
jgi:hypothetical protein